MCDCNIDRSERCCEGYCVRPIQWAVVLKGEGSDMSRRRFVCGHCYLKFCSLGLVEEEFDGREMADAKRKRDLALYL
jgi:hypothetical protein